MENRDGNFPSSAKEKKNQNGTAVAQRNYTPPKVFAHHIQRFNSWMNEYICDIIATLIFAWFLQIFLFCMRILKWERRQATEPLEESEEWRCDTMSNTN